MIRNIEVLVSQGDYSFHESSWGSFLWWNPQEDRLYLAPIVHPERISSAHPPYMRTWLMGGFGLCFYRDD